MRSLEEMRDKDFWALQIPLKYLDLLLDYYISLMKFLARARCMAKSSLWRRMNQAVTYIYHSHLPSFYT